MSDKSGDLVTVSTHTEFQGVTIWLGDGAPCTIDDRNNAEDVRDWISRPMQRAVTATRLRAIADMLDGPDHPENR